MGSAMGELSKKDVENAIRLLQAALKYEPVEVDTDEDDVLRWEAEGGPTKD